MTESVNFAAGEGRQYRAYGIAAAMLLALLVCSDREAYRRFMGVIPPLGAYLGAVIVGAIMLHGLKARGGFSVLKSDRAAERWSIPALAAVFGIVIAVADAVIVFPIEMNVPWPRSLFFYPVIGFIVEVFFHLVPLGILLHAVGAALRRPVGARGIWFCLLAVSLLEPAFQGAALYGQGRYAAGAVVFVGAHVWLINLAGLWFFRKYDFLSMYAFRLVYYLFWHILWGHLRLGLLF
ncbi:MAG TPA: hypothetical protein ENN21_05555 [Spirochaetes bacterium]|nr:hypothetical protein [Spirochaetota bacterium]